MTFLCSYLNDNGLELVKGQLFGTSSSSTIREALDLRNNNLRVLPTDTFFDVAIENLWVDKNMSLDKRFDKGLNKLNLIFLFRICG